MLSKVSFRRFKDKFSCLSDSEVKNPCIGMGLILAFGMGEKDTTHIIIINLNMHV